jgi:hypothetical protein
MSPCGFIESRTSLAKRFHEGGRATRSRRYLRHGSATVRVVRRSVAPAVLALAWSGTFILAQAMVGTREHGIFPNGLPFLALVIIWIVWYFIIFGCGNTGIFSIKLTN